MSKPLVVVSSAPEDGAWARLIDKGLRSLDHGLLVETWSRERVPAGKVQGESLQQAVKRASVGVMLLSMDYLVWETGRLEDIPALEGARGRADIIPVVVRPCPWRSVSWLAKMQLFPSNGRALSGGTEHDIDQAVSDLAELVYDLLLSPKELRK